MQIYLHISKIFCNFVADFDEVTYSGEGSYDLTAHYVNHIGKCIDWNAVVDGEQEPLKVEDVEVGFFSKGGDVRLEYKVTLK